MPSYPVKQPDGKLAIWSTIVDHFTAFDCDIDECARELSYRYRDPIDKLRQWCAETLDGKVDYRDWPDLLGMALARFGPTDETVKEAMDRTPDELTRRYAEKIQHIWRIERELDDMRDDRRQLRSDNEKLSALAAAVPVLSIAGLVLGVKTQSWQMAQAHVGDVDQWLVSIGEVQP